MSTRKDLSPATLVQIAEAVTHKMRTLKLDDNLDVDMSYTKTVDPLRSARTRIIVVPREVSYLPLDRTSNKFHAHVDVYVSKQMLVGSQHEIDPLMRLVESVADGFRNQRLGNFLAARCISLRQHSLKEKALLRRNRFEVRIELIFEMAI